MKRLIYVAIIASIALGLGCAKAEDDKQVPFFSDVSTITLNTPADKTIVNSTSNPFNFVLPTDVKISYFVLGVFIVQPSLGPNNSFSGGMHADGGVYTGMSGITMSATNVSVPSSALRAYDQSMYNGTGGYNSSALYAPPTLSGSNYYWWLVWAYDSNGNLVASSPAIRVNF